MSMVQEIMTLIPESKLAQIRSQIIDMDKKIRQVRLNIPLSIPVVDSCGCCVKMDCVIRGTIDISHEEIARLGNTTVEEIDAIPSLVVEQTAPFLAPTMSKFQLVLEDPEAYKSNYQVDADGTWPWESAVVEQPEEPQG